MSLDWVQGIKMKSLNDNPAIGFLLLHMPVVESKEIKTDFGTNGKTIMVNPDILKKKLAENGLLYPKQQHEYMRKRMENEVTKIILHSVERFNRLPKGEKEVFNLACDVVINSQVLEESDYATEMNFSSLSQQGYLQEFRYTTDLQIEKVYESILNQLDKQPKSSSGQGQGQGNGQGQNSEQSGNNGGNNQDNSGKDKGDSQKDNNSGGKGRKNEDKDSDKNQDNQDQNNSPFPNYTPDMTDEQTDSDDMLNNQSNREGYGNPNDYLKDLVNKAIAIGKYAGKGRGEMFKVLESLVAIRRNWRSVLRNVLQKMFSNTGSEASFARPHRRFYQIPYFQEQGFIIPTKLDMTLDNSGIAIDSSCSIDNELYKDWCQEMLGIAHDLRIGGYILIFDDGVRKTFKIRGINNAKVTELLKNRSQGGTDLTEVFQFAERNHLKTLIIFTDTWANLPVKKRYPFNTVIFTYEKNYNKPIDKYGKVVVLERKGE